MDDGTERSTGLLEINEALAESLALSGGVALVDWIVP